MDVEFRPEIPHKYICESNDNTDSTDHKKVVLKTKCLTKTYFFSPSNHHRMALLAKQILGKTLKKYWDILINKNKIAS